VPSRRPAAPVHLADTENRATRGSAGSATDRPSSRRCLRSKAPGLAARRDSRRSAASRFTVPGTVTVRLIAPRTTAFAPNRALVAAWRWKPAPRSRSSACSRSLLGRTNIKVSPAHDRARIRPRGCGPAQHATALTRDGSAQV